MTRIAGVRVLFRRSVSLFRLARRPSEVLSVSAFLLSYVRSWLTPMDRRRMEATISLQGGVYTVGLRGGESATFREIYLEKQYERLSGFIPEPGWTVVDIGANIGIYTVQAAKRGAQVYAFEPNDESYRRLVRNVNQNGISERVTALKCAVGSEEGFGMVVTDGWTIHGQIVPLARPTHTVPHVVDVVALDAIVRSLGLERIDLLKVDVEGGEVEVLRGAPDSLRIIDRIVMEYHSRTLLQQVHALLCSRGFSCVVPHSADEDGTVGLLYAMRTTPEGGGAAVQAR